MSTLFIGLDDTDTPTSTGTGHLAREIASTLAARFPLTGVTRHQLLFDPRVPMTAKNSANVVHLEVNLPLFDGAGPSQEMVQLADEVAELVRTRSHPGSDPGLCLAMNPPPAVTEFGQRAKVALLAADEARTLADAHHLILRPLGGNGGGIIGALAAVGLAGAGNDGRFTRVGNVRDLREMQPVDAILAAGIASVQTPEGQVVESGLVATGNKLRPSLIGGQPVLLVQPVDGVWRVIRRD